MPLPPNTPRSTLTGRRCLRPAAQLSMVLAAALALATAASAARASTQTQTQTAVQGNINAAQAYEQALREHMKFFRDQVLKQAATPSYQLELVWGVVPAIGTIVDLDPANQADQDTSCVVPKASLPEEQLIREVPMYTEVQATSGSLNLPLIGLALEKLKMFSVAGSQKQTLQYGIADTRQVMLSPQALERHFKTSAACKEALLGDETQTVLVVRGLIYGRETFETDATGSASATLGNQVVGGMSLKIDPSTKKAVIADTVAKPKFFIVSAVKRGQRGSKMEDIFSAPSEDELRRFREALQRRR
jgi:hypothetical protein